MVFLFGRKEREISKFYIYTFWVREKCTLGMIVSVNMLCGKYNLKKMKTIHLFVVNTVSFYVNPQTRAVCCSNLAFFGDSGWGS